MKLAVAYTRGLVLVVGASFVLGALVTCLCVKMSLDLAGGVGVQSGDWTSLAISGIGGGAIVGISQRAVWRERASIGWRVYGGLLGVATISGIVFGAAVGARISNDHVSYVRGQAVETCAAFGAVHPDLADRCAARAIPCRVEVRASPPVALRGVRVEEGQGISREPTDPIEHAVWACIARP